MDNIEFRKLYEDELYDSFLKVLSWDMDKKFTDYNEYDFERYISYAEPYGMYKWDISWLWYDIATFS